MKTINIGKKLKELRKENNYTQQNVADFLCVSRVVYNRYENNQREIPIEIVCSLADLYHVSVDYICGRDI